MPAKGVNPDPSERALGLMRRVLQRLLGIILVDFLDLLRALPEEEIGADRRAENGHYRRDRGRARDRRHDQAFERRGPVDLHHEEQGNIGQMKQGQPIE